MATSGSVSVTVTSWDTLKFSWWVSSQSVAANTTTIGWRLELVAGSSGRIDSSAAKAWAVTVNGTAYSGTNTIGIGNNATKTLASGSTVIAHNADGSKSFAFSFSQAFGINFSGSSIGTKSGSGTGTLDTIPRATTPTLSASAVDMGNAVTISLPRASGSFTHDLAYSFAGAAYVSIATGVDTSYSWTVPDKASSIPNATSGTFTVRCITKNGSTVVGTKTVTLTGWVPASVVPVISAVTATEATAGLAAQFGAFVQGYSKLAVKITAAGAKGSTIKSYKTTLQGATHTDASFTSDVLTASGTLAMVTTVTDSRGRSASRTTNITVLAYTPPHVSEFVAYRCDDSGRAQADGIYLHLTFVYDVALLGNKNTAAMVVDYKRTTATGWTVLQRGSSLEGSGIMLITNTTFSTDYQFDVRMTVTDYFGKSTSYTVRLPTGAVVLDIKADGTGMGFGKVSEKGNSLEFNRDLYDKFGTLIGNGLSVYNDANYNRPDPNETLEHLVLTEGDNAPGGGFWYIWTLFYSTKSVTSNRTQLALPYNAAGGLYVRYYFSGAWSAWRPVPQIAETGTSGIWKYTKYSDGTVELLGTYNVSNVACTTALGGWFRTAVLQPSAFPFTVYDPVLTPSYESAGYGALLWATTETSTTAPANFYLIRPTSATITSGKIMLRVTGRWK